MALETKSPDIGIIATCEVATLSNEHERLSVCSLSLDPPSKVEPGTGLLILQGPDVRKQLVETFGSKTLRQLVAD